MRSPLLCGALVLSVGAILAFTIPWDSWQDHSHWSRVEWIPFRTHYGTWLERLLNVALFVPLGATLRVWGRRVWVCALLGGLLSVAVELAQVYSHGRLPTATDVAFNTIGTIVGAALAGWWRPRWRGSRSASWGGSGRGRSVRRHFRHRFRRLKSS